MAAGKRKDRRIGSLECLKMGSSSQRVHSCSKTMPMNIPAGMPSQNGESDGNCAAGKGSRANPSENGTAYDFGGFRREKGG